MSNPDYPTLLQTISFAIKTDYLGNSGYDSKLESLACINHSTSKGLGIRSLYINYKIETITDNFCQSLV